jgi:hemerythrin-like domain-containing protein
MQIMAEMSMNKAIHGAFRRDINRFLQALGAFKDGDKKRADQLATAWANFDNELTYHHEGEHETAWPALEAVGVSRELLAEMDAEHDTMASALTETRTAMAALAQTAKATDAEAALRAFEHLRTVTVAHLDHEEAELEPVYLAKRDDPVIKAMGRKFGKVSPVRGGRFMAWLTDGASPDEMASIKGNVPPPVLAIIGGIFGRGYRKDVASVWK